MEICSEDREGGGTQNLKIASQFSTIFETISEGKFKVGPTSQSVLGDISGRGAAQNLKIAAQLSAKLAQFFDTILKSKSAFGGPGVSGVPLPAFCKKMNSIKF